MSERTCSTCANRELSRTAATCLECYGVAGRPNWEPVRCPKCDDLSRRVAELEQENERLRTAVANAQKRGVILREPRPAAKGATLASIVAGTTDLAEKYAALQDRAAELEALASWTLRALEWFRKQKVSIKRGGGGVFVASSAVQDVAGRLGFYTGLCAAVGAEVGPEEGDAK